MDADKWTDKELLKIEKELDAIYKQASEETAKRAKDFFDKYKVEDAEQKKKVQSGEITETQYKKWRRTQMMQGAQYNAMKRQTAMDLTHANEKAMAYVNNQLPKVYVANYNAVKSSVDGIGGYSFTLVNEDAVKYVYQNIDKTLLPIKDVNKAKDIAWNSKRINSQILQGIIQGDSIDKISDRLKKATGMTEGAAVRNARTAVTGAQNRGRLDSFERCEDDGIEIKKEWVATLDMRTRPEHGELDGQSVPLDEPFENAIGKIMYPGDSDADPANVYNCRCTLKGDVGQRRSNQRMARDEKGHSVLVEDMTYEEWYEAKVGGNIFDFNEVDKQEEDDVDYEKELAKMLDSLGIDQTDVQLQDEDEDDDILDMVFDDDDSIDEDILLEDFDYEDSMTSMQYHDEYIVPCQENPSVGEMLEMEEGFFDGLTEEQAQALIDYTGSDYWDMNGFLRDIGAGMSEAEAVAKWGEDIAEKVRIAHDAMQTASLDRDMVFRRGTDVGDLAGLFMGGNFDENKAHLEKMSAEELNDMFSGMVGTYFGFTSTSSQWDRGFSDDVEIMLFAPKGTKASSIMKISQYGTDEGETLFADGTQVICRRIEKSDGHKSSKIRVFLEIIP